jgi:hypothetical protein
MSEGEDMKRESRLPALVAAGLVVGGCATSRPPPSLVPDRALLNFLLDGTTARTEVLSRLGEPSTVFEQDRILTYRIAGDPDRGFWIRERTGQPNTGWIGVNRNLVLVFDEQGLLQRHSLVVVQ